MPSQCLRIRRGQFEAVIFSDVLNQSRELLEPGTPVVITVEAELDGETVKMRVQGIESLNAAAGSVRCGLRLTLDHAALGNGEAKMLLDEVRRCLQPGRDEIRLLVAMPDRGQACELALNGRFDTSPTVRGILSTIDGVLDVAECGAD